MQLLAFILFIYMNFYIIKVAKRNKIAKNILDLFNNPGNNIILKWAGEK